MMQVDWRFLSERHSRAEMVWHGQAKVTVAVAVAQVRQVKIKPEASALLVIFQARLLFMVQAAAVAEISA
jgi:hypothetical protein